MTTGFAMDQQAAPAPTTMRIARWEFIALCAALMALRRRIERWAKDGDETQIRRANRVIEAIDDKRDAG